MNLIIDFLSTDPSDDFISFLQFMRSSPLLLNDEKECFRFIIDFYGSHASYPSAYLAERELGYSSDRSKPLPLADLKFIWRKKIEERSKQSASTLYSEASIATSEGRIDEANAYVEEARRVLSASEDIPIDISRVNNASLMSLVEARAGKGGVISGIDFIDNLIGDFDSGTATVLAAFTSSGKAQPLNSIVYTKKGEFRFGDLSIGDKILGSDGEVYVTGIYPQGVMSVYEVTFCDGSKVRSTLDHLWRVSFNGYDSNRTYITTTLDYILRNLPSDLEDHDDFFDFSVDLCPEFDFINVLNIISYTTLVDSIFSGYIELSLLKSLPFLNKKDKYEISKRLIDKAERQSDIFLSYYLDFKDDCISDNMVNFFRSCGFYSYKCFKNGIFVSLDKRVKYIISVKYVGEFEAQCISVSAKDCLYLTNDFTLTHNTTTALSIALNNALKGVRSAYLTLESTTSELKIKTISAYSFAYNWGGDPIEYLSLLKNRLTDKQRDSLPSLDENYRSMPGRVDFFSPSAIKGDFAKSLPLIAKYYAENGYQLFIVDQAQLLQYYARDIDNISVVNRLVKELTDVAVSMDEHGYNFRVMFLSQINREAYKAAVKTNGEYNISALAQYSELERSASYILTLFMNDALKSASQCRIQLLKSRNGQTSEEPESITISLPYSFVGSDDVMKGFNPSQSDIMSMFSDIGLL